MATGLVLLAAGASAAISGPLAPGRPPPSAIAAPSAPGSPTADCRAPGAEIVVCGRRTASDRYRLRADLEDDRFRDAPVRAETGLAGGKLTAHGQQANVGGFVSNRAMITWSLPF